MEIIEECTVGINEDNNSSSLYDISGKEVGND
jgi:hypothetical protein